MKKVTFLIFLLSVLSSCIVYRMHKLTHNPSDSYFVKGKKYHYNTFYIDSLGDTVVRGKLIIAPTGKPWIAQPGVQESVNYYHFVDSLEYVKFIDPEPFFAKRNSDYLAKKHKLKFNKKENTGGYMKTNYFYIHPPRTNQFRLLFYSPHPWMANQLLNDSSYNEFNVELKFFGPIMSLMSTYKLKPISKSSLSSFPSSIKVWQVDIDSKMKFKDTTKTHYNGLYNSTVEAEFCKEFAYIKMHYRFENGIQVLFNFEKMTEE